MSKSTDILQAVLDKNGWTHEQLAKKLGVRPSYISQSLKRRSQIRSDRWMSWSKILGIDPMTGLEPKSPRVVSLVSESRGSYMVQDEKGIWRPFNLRSDPEKYEAGTVLAFKDADGVEIKVQVFCGPNGRKTIVPI